jgi:uncharacterized protein YxjI
MTRKSRRERREARRGGGSTRYQMRQKLVAFGDDLYIEDDQGQNDILILAATVAIDMMAHEGN